MMQFAGSPHLLELFAWLMVLAALAALLYLHRDRRRIARVAARREAQQAALLAAAPDAVLRIENKTRVFILNTQAEKLLGKEGTIPFNELTEIIPGLVLTEDSGRARLRARMPDGNSLPLDIAWSSFALTDAHGQAEHNVLLVARDISLREQIESRLRERDAALARAARVATAGELASALAHELNQPMTALIGYLRAARLIEKSDPRTDTRLGTTLDKAGDEALRAADILRRLRDFYIGRAPKSEVFAVSGVVDSMIEEYRTRHPGKALELSVAHADPMTEVNADRMYVEIILSNLLNNALEALQDRPQARIDVVTRADNDSLVVAVDDNGPGIATDHTMIFKPFYTSKAEGMGLGLAMSRSLAESLGGSLRNVSSQLGGARFELRLPMAKSLP